MKKPPSQAELFGRDLPAAQPRGVRKLSASTLRAIDTLRRYGFAVSRAGAQHLCRRRGRLQQLDDRQIKRFADDLEAAGPPPSAKASRPARAPEKHAQVPPAQRSKIENSELPLGPVRS